MLMSKALKQSIDTFCLWDSSGASTDTIWEINMLSILMILSTKCLPVVHEHIHKLSHTVPSVTAAFAPVVTSEDTHCSQSPLVPCQQFATAPCHIVPSFAISPCNNILMCCERCAGSLDTQQLGIK